MILPNKQSALSCHDFLYKACSTNDGQTTSLFSSDNALSSSFADKGECYDPNAVLRVLDLKAHGVHAVVFPAATEYAIEAKSYWQHTGEVRKRNYIP